jgi:hypothetical protein
MVKVGRRDILIFAFVGDAPDVYDRWDNVSLLLIESILSLKPGLTENTKHVLSANP